MTPKRIFKWISSPQFRQQNRDIKRDRLLVALFRETDENERNRLAVKAGLVDAASTLATSPSHSLGNLTAQVIPNNTDNSFEQLYEVRENDQLVMQAARTVMRKPVYDTGALNSLGLSVSTVTKIQPGAWMKDLLQAHEQPARRTASPAQPTAAHQ